MKILFLALGDETFASSRTRVFQYLPYLKRDNIKCKVLIYTRKNLTGKKLLFYNAEKYFTAYILFKLLMFSLFYDVVFIQKVLCHEIVIKVLRLFKKKVIFDFDDAIYTIHQASEEKADPQLKLKINERFNRIIALSNLIVLENGYTKKYVEQYNANILMITGPIDTVRYFPREKQSKENIVIGWIGSPANTMYLEPLCPVFERLSKEHQNICFKTIGAAHIELTNSDVKQIRWALDTEVSELQEFDIGIMPLPDDEWSRGKGGYKLLQYMALGIPSVASPVGINAEMIEDGINGFLAKDENDWYEKLCYLINNPDKRKLIGLNARKIAEKKYSFDVATQKLCVELSRPERIL